MRATSTAVDHEPSREDELVLEVDEGIAPGPPATPDARKSVKTQPGLGTASTPPPAPTREAAGAFAAPVAAQAPRAPAPRAPEEEPIEIPSAWGGLARHKWIAVAVGALLVVVAAVVVLGGGSSTPATHHVPRAAHRAQGPLRPAAPPATPLPRALEPAAPTAPPPLPPEPVSPAATATVASPSAARVAPEARAPAPAPAPAPRTSVTRSARVPAARTPAAPVRPRARRTPSREDTLDPFAR